MPVEAAFAILAFISLSAGFQTIEDYIFSTTEKAFFKHINDNIHKDM